MTPMQALQWGRTVSCGNNQMCDVLGSRAWKRFVYWPVNACIVSAMGNTASVQWQVTSESEFRAWTGPAGLVRGGNLCVLLFKGRATIFAPWPCWGWGREGHMNLNIFGIVVNFNKSQHSFWKRKGGGCDLHPSENKTIKILASKKSHISQVGKICKMLVCRQSTFQTRIHFF